jgi:hypothetical protein
MRVGVKQQAIEQINSKSASGMFYYQAGPWGDSWALGCCRNGKPFRGSRKKPSTIDSTVYKYLYRNHEHPSRKAIRALRRKIELIISAYLFALLSASVALKLDSYFGKLALLPIWGNDANV